MGELEELPNQSDTPLVSMIGWLKTALTKPTICCRNTTCAVGHNVATTYAEFTGIILTEDRVLTNSRLLARGKIFTKLAKDMEISVP